MNIQRLDIDPDTLPSYDESEEYEKNNKKNASVSPDTIKEILEDIKNAKRPMVLV
jgi:thiamine pyrophosphate-dependent acetolactate synthase large subunit-like protein